MGTADLAIVESPGKTSKIGTSRSLGTASTRRSGTSGTCRRAGRRPFREQVAAVLRRRAARSRRALLRLGSRVAADRRQARPAREAAARRAQQRHPPMARPCPCDPRTGLLTSVDLGLTATNAAFQCDNSYCARLGPVDAGTTHLGTLSTPTSLVAGTNTFTAPGTGLDLAPNTTYAVLFDVINRGNGQGRLGVTSSDAEDPGAVEGWSIDDRMSRKPFSPGGDWTIDSASVWLAIKGYGKRATTPAVNGVEVVSAPTHDSDCNGRFDTYVRGDRIVVDVGFSEPVAVMGGNANVKVRLDLGTDDTDLTKQPEGGGAGERALQRQGAAFPLYGAGPATRTRTASGCRRPARPTRRWCSCPALRRRRSRARTRARPQIRRTAACRPRATH